MFEDDDLFEFLEIDEAATSKRARKVLKNYTKLKSMVSESISAGTSNFSENGHIKKKGTNSDIVGNLVARKVKAEQELMEIERALECVDDDYYKVLKAKYTKSYFDSDINIYVNLGLSERSFYRYIKKGEVQFAEEYKAGKLIVFKD